MQRVFSPICVLSLMLMSACGVSPSASLKPQEPAAKLSSSGTIIISGLVPKKATVSSLASKRSKSDFAPLLGYVPNFKIKNPAINEYWLEVQRDSSKVALKQGDTTLRTFPFEGRLALETPLVNEDRQLVLESVEKQPSWYAPDSYFTAREQQIPAEGSPERFRRGALGSAALFASEGLILHSSPLWTAEVGGLRMSPSDIAELGTLLAPGTRVFIN